MVVEVTESEEIEVVAKVAIPDTFNVPVAVRFVEVALPVTRALPETVRVEPGVVVPIPTLPFASTVKSDEVAKAADVVEAMEKRGAVAP